MKGDNETYSGKVGDDIDFSVKNGKFETIMTINETEWYNRYQKAAKSIPNDFPPISKISDNITINVMYTAAGPQPSSVIKVLGSRGELVSGVGTEHFGTGTAGRLTTLSASKEFYLPFKR